MVTGPMLKSSGYKSDSLGEAPEAGEAPEGRLVEPDHGLVVTVVPAEPSAPCGLPPEVSV